MRRLVILIAAGAPLVCLAAPGGAAAAPANRDSVQGTATHLGVLTVRSSDIGQRRRGEVTCLNVAGNTATIGVKIVRAEDPAAVGMGELWNVVDNGAGGDRIAGYALTATPPTLCPPLSFSVPVVSGNYRVSG